MIYRDFGLSLPDLFAFAFFVLAWAAYHFLLGHGPGAETGLNQTMDRYRIRWMIEMSERDNRIMDASLMGSLQNGTAFSPRPRCWPSVPRPRSCARPTMC